MDNHYVFLEITFFILMIIYVSIVWYKNEKPVWKSFVFPLWTCLTFYLNAPNFLVLNDGFEMKTKLLLFPFNLYNKWGLLYIIFSNVFLASIGAYLGKPDSVSRYSEKETKKLFDNFIADSTEVKVIGRDLNFLLDSNYTSQKDQIIKLKGNAKLLCERTEDIELIELYKMLLEEGVQVRAYSSREGVANLKGQIKKNQRGDKSGIFVVKDTRLLDNKTKEKKEYEIIDLKSEYLLEGVDNQFNITFSNSIHPVVRCIALDLGGVYLDGDIDTFYNYLNQKYGIKMKRRKRDRLNIDDDLMLGKIGILDYIKKCVPESANKIATEEWDDILQNWQLTWTPNPKMKELVEFLDTIGYKIIPFSNLDSENGDKYLRDHYLPACCTHHYFSYENGKAKPNRATFKDFSLFLKNHSYIEEEYQILLIDDEQKNLDVAAKLNWQTIHFFNDSVNNDSVNDNTSIDKLVQELKQKSILPDRFSF